MKLRLEFDWLRLWSSAWGKRPRKDASAMRIAGDTYQFEEWVRLGRENATRVFEGGKWLPMALTEADLAARTAWNKANRRAVDIRPVDNRERAAREVLKYITKGADFSDSSEAVEQFMDAVKGARLIQTFGTWYGAKFDTVFDPEHMDDWGEMKCTCGLNCWERIGVFYKRDVEMTEAGRWQLKRTHAGTCRGTVPRPMIRTLDESCRSDSESAWETR